MSPSKRRESASQMEVEKMIVDYLAYEANRAVLDDFASGQTLTDDVESAIDSAESWLSIFSRHFPTEKLDSKASFRLKLLQLITLTSQRSIPELEDFDISRVLDSARLSHGRRRSHFAPSRSSTCPLSKSQLAQLPIGVEYRAHHVDVLRSHGANNIDPPLSKLLTLLCRLSAYRGTLQKDSLSTTRDWMNCVGQLMLQTALEMILVHGCSDEDDLRDIFAWKWKTDGDMESSSPKHHEKEQAEWAKIKAGWAGLLAPASKSTSLSHHLLRLAAAYPLHKFERDMMNFLASLHESVSKPRLSQVEEGQIEGISSAESAQLLRRAGVAI